MVKIISIVSGKGGVGKTTFVTNLGVALASQFKKNVVVVDTNLSNPHLGLCMGNLSVWPFSLNDVLKNKVDIEKAMYAHPSGVHVIPASFESRDLARMNMYRLRRKMEQLFGSHDIDYVLLDSAPGITRESRITCSISNEILFIATPHLPSIIDIKKVIESLKVKDAKPVGVIINRTRNRRYELTAEEIEQITHLPVMGLVPDDERVLKSTNMKTPVLLMDPKSMASKAFVNLASEITGETMFHTQGAFSRLFSRLLRR